MGRPAFDCTPFATTERVLGPVSILPAAGTRKLALDAAFGLRPRELKPEVLA